MKAWNEFKISMKGIYRMHALFTTTYRYPIFLYIFRNLPPSLVKKFYESNMRKKLLENNLRLLSLFFEKTILF